MSDIGTPELYESKFAKMGWRDADRRIKMPQMYAAKTAKQEHEQTDACLLQR